MADFHCKTCKADRDNPFCSTCGARLTENEYIGKTIEHLAHYEEEVNRELRFIDSSLRERESKYKRDIEPSLKSQEKHQQEWRLIQEAKDWARKHNLHTPDFYL